jgi:ABC-type dipeptide/oligopeptide/nickel transport system permease component
VTRYLFILRRAGQALVALLVILIAVFLMLEFVPGDPARQVAGPRASEETVAKVREALGLDQPLPVQFGLYLERLVHGDLGATINSGIPVVDLIANAAPVTFTVVALAVAITLLIASGLTGLSTRRPGSTTDRATQFLATVGVGVPSFLMGILLLMLFAVVLGWFPVGGWSRDPLGQFQSAFLPALTLALAVAPVLYASMRSAILGVRRMDYVDAARSVGLRGWSLSRHFEFRNAAIPPVALLTSMASIMLSGAVVVEATFGLPGLGLALVEGARMRDFNVVQGLTLVFALAVLCINVLGDVLLVMLDPRVEL